jgi:ubiquinone/menaquinone biosynthesis C-methylase UbiE
MSGPRPADPLSSKHDSPVGAHPDPPGFGTRRTRVDFWDDHAAAEATRDEDQPEDLIYHRIVGDILRDLIAADDTVIDIGGGTGRFSLDLAERVRAVTHLDLSENMLAIARERCAVRDLENVTFVQADALDLSTIADQSFSVGLAINGVITFSATDWERAISEACRVTRRTVVMTAASIISTVPAVLAGLLSTYGSIEPPVERMLTERTFFGEEAARYDILFPSYRAFLPEELEASLRRHGFDVLEVRGIASLSRFLSDDVLRKIVSDQQQLERFLDLEHAYTNMVGRRSPAREWLLVAERKRG